MRWWRWPIWRWPRPEDLVSLAAISKRQDISLPYLEQLFVKLRRAGLVEAVRGPGGGYRLARSPDAIRVSEILEAVDETVSALHTGAGATGGVSGTRAQSLTNRLWEGLSAHVYVFLHQTRLVGRDPQRNAPLPGGAGAVPGGGRGGGRCVGRMTVRRPDARRGCLPLVPRSRSSPPRILCQDEIRAAYDRARLSGLERDDAAAARGAGGDDRGDGCGGQPVLGPCRGAGGQGADRAGAGAGGGRPWGRKGPISSSPRGATEAAALACAGRGLVCAACGA